MPKLRPAQPACSVEHFFYRGSCLGCLNGSYTTACSSAEKESILLHSIMVDGKLFQSLIDLEKNSVGVNK